MMRRGMTIAELMVALFIMTTAMVAIVQLLAAAAGQRRTIEQRRLALAEVANEAERVALITWDESAPDKLTTWQPSAELKAALPQATCTAEVTEESGPPAARRIRLSVTWPNSVGQTGEPIAVSLWKFKEEQP
jgi:Tfp pilus assembly protein PilV